MDRGHIVVSVELDDESKTVSSYTLVDYSATGYAFVDKEFVHDNTSAKKIWSRTITSGPDSTDRSTCGLLCHASAHLHLIHSCPLTFIQARPYYYRTFLLASGMYRPITIRLGAS